MRTDYTGVDVMRSVLNDIRLSSHCAADDARSIGGVKGIVHLAINAPLAFYNALGDGIVGKIIFGNRELRC